jgi:two-component system response regulator CpxR
VLLRKKYEEVLNGWPVDADVLMDRKSEAVPARILVIDDDVELCKLVSRFLGSDGYAVETTHDSGEGIELVLCGEYDLVVLDVMLPGLDGFEVLRRIRVKSNTPVLMLTARGDDLDRILGLEIGADDYLAKPFNPRELAGRIRAILRRAKSASAVGAHSAASPIKIADLELNSGARTVRRGSELVKLTAVEFDLLNKLMESPGRVIGREELTREVLGREFSPFDRGIDTHIWSLRKKVGTALNGTERIKGVRGVGYFYALPEISKKR